MDIKKESFIEAYKKTFGNITECCKACEIKTRKTYYRWLEDDPEFKEAIENIEPDDCFIDFCEDALTKKIKDGDSITIVSFLSLRVVMGGTSYRAVRVSCIPAR